MMNGSILQRGVGMYCIHCGAELPDGAKFCTRCGVRVDDAETPTPKSVPRPASRRSATGQPSATSQPSASGQPSEQAPQAPNVSRRAFIGLGAAAAVGAVAFAATQLGGQSGPASGGYITVADSSASSAAAAGNSASSAAASNTTQTPKESDDSEPGLDCGGSSAGLGTPRAALNDYSWDELARISRNMAYDAGTIAKTVDAYHLVARSSDPDGVQRKEITLKNGLTIKVRVVGVSHDVSSDGSKRHGLTFMTNDCVALRSMNASGKNAGGWERSDLRAWLNGDFISLLPDDLASLLQPTQKLTNNVGKTTSTSSVTTTVDKVWAPSLVELVGADQVSGVDWPAQYADADQIFNKEGSQYEYTAGCLASDPNDTLIMDWNGQLVSWWERSPHPGFDTYFKGVSTMGVPVEGEDPAQSLGVVACFCV